MSDSIHGHQVMKMMAKSAKTYNKPALLAEIAAKFGDNACFHTCAHSDLTADALLDFFISKGKFIESEAGIYMPKRNLCE